MGLHPLNVVIVSLSRQVELTSTQHLGSTTIQTTATLLHLIKRRATQLFAQWTSLLGALRLAIHLSTTFCHWMVALTTARSPSISLSIVKRSWLPLVQLRPRPQSQKPRAQQHQPQAIRLRSPIQLRWPRRQPPPHLLHHKEAAVALGYHATVLGTLQRIVGQNGTIVELPQAIATLSRFGVVLMQLVAVVKM